MVCVQKKKYAWMDVDVLCVVVTLGACVCGLCCVG